MKVYCFSGVGADERVFQYLNLEPGFELIPVPWIAPEENESIEFYSKRISKFIPLDEPCGIMGVSFGRVVAQEVTKILNPQVTIVISSIKDKSQIPFPLKVIPDFILNITPKFFFKLPKPFAYWLFGAVNKDLLSRIFDDTDSGFVKWSIKALKNWKSDGGIRVHYISGEKDRLLKPFKEAEIIKGGHHLVIVDEAEEINIVINKYLSKVKL